MNPIFESKIISFVPLSERLVKDYLILINDFENVQKHIRRHSVPREPFTEEQELNWVRNKLAESACIFSMLEKGTGDFIGNIEFKALTDSDGELGISVTADKQNKGFGTQAVSAMVAYGFDRLGLKRIFLKANPENGRALRVYEKCGFRETDRTDDHVLMEMSQ